MSGTGDKKRRRALAAFHALQRVAERSVVPVDAAVAPFGLTGTQFAVLDLLIGHDAQQPLLHQQELADRLGRSKAQMTAILDALDRRGLVRRERHATDRRRIGVRLTLAGRAAHARAEPARSAAIVSLMEGLSGDQRAKLGRLCRRLLKALDPSASELAESELAESDADGDAEADAESDADASDPSIDADRSALYRSVANEYPAGVPAVIPDDAISGPACEIPVESNHGAVLPLHDLRAAAEAALETLGPIDRAVDASQIHPIPAHGRTPLSPDPRAHPDS
jgi:MarR family 2-MHQ and catechol resistance regulon transcriptional repressor